MKNLLQFITIIAFTLCFTVQSKAQSKTYESHIPDEYGFVVKGVSGNPVMLDRTWYQDPKPDGTGGWTKSMRTMSGNELSTTVITYSKEPTEKDRFSGATMIMVFVQTLNNDNVLVPITWVDVNNEPASAPKGLEHIKEANGATGVVTYASLTPLTGKTAFGLNYVKFAGMKGWKKGETRDIKAYFASFGSMKGCVVVDDRTNIGSVYDGISTDPTKYPTTVPNFTPHSGLLNGIKFK